MERREEQKTEGKNLLREAGLSFTVTVALIIACSFVVTIVAAGLSNRYQETVAFRYASYLLPQICLFLAAFVYFRRTKRSVKTVAAPCKPVYFLIAILLQFGLLSLSELNGLFLKALSRIGYKQEMTELPPLDGWNLLPAMLAIALLPALFEETLFRGILTGNMRESGWGTAATALVGGAMFSLFHTNPAQTVYQFACGVCFALVAIRSGSALPTMVSHFLNNALVLAMTAAGLEDFPEAVKLPLYLTAGVVLAAVGAWLIFDKNNTKKGGIREGRSFFAGAGAGIALCAVMWIATLVTGIVGG